MNTELKIELSPQQQELVLKGLRFVRSSVALEMRDVSDEVDAHRRAQYEKLDELEALLTAATRRSAATV